VVLGVPTLHPLLWDHYQAVRERVHAIPAALPYRHRRLTEAECEACERAMEAIASGKQRAGESASDALARVVPAALEHWMRQRRGREDYLVRERHPLHELARDLDWLVGEMLVRRAAQRVAPPPVQQCSACGAPHGSEHARWCQAAARVA
jgi:hypothetical protein